MVCVFHNLLTEPRDWHPSTNSMDFDRLEGEDVARLEEPFSMEEDFFCLVRAKWGQKAHMNYL